MKINRLLKVLSLSLLVLFTACSDYEDTVVPSPDRPAGNQGVYFPTDNSSLFELEPAEATQITLTIAREVSTGSVSVPITVEVNDDNVFNVPQSVTFADGETEVDFVVTFPNAVEGVAYNLKLAVVGDDIVNPYGSDLPNLSTVVSRIKWSPVPRELVYVDGTFITLFGVTIHPMYVEADSVKLDNSTRYRLKNVYKVPTSGTPDADGIYDGYRFNEPGDFDDSKDWLTTIEIDNSGNVTMEPNDIGVDWSYGMISIGTIYGNVSQDISSYPLGTFADDVITFPSNSLYFSMAGYQNGGKYPAGTPTIIYLTKEAFIAANLKIEDFNDVEYEEIEGALGVYESAAYGDSWNTIISEAIDLDEENEDSDYKNLFYISNAYEDGYGLAFYNYDGVIRIPANQPTGDVVFGQDLFVSQSPNIESSVEVNEKGITVYTFGLIFHYEDGTIVGDFTETFYYSKDVVEYGISDFTGSFLLTGESQFGEDPAEMDVEIEEGDDANTLVITGVELTDKLIATFDTDKFMMSIAPQSIADLSTSTATYAAKFHTTPPYNTEGTATIDFVLDMKGNLVISPDSEADGYLIRGTTAEGSGGWFDGYFDLKLTKVAGSATVSTTATQNASTLKLRSSLVQNKSNSKVMEHNFVIQGKKTTDRPKSILNNNSTSIIY